MLLWSRDHPGQIALWVLFSIAAASLLTACAEPGGASPRAEPSNPVANAPPLAPTRPGPPSPTSTALRVTPRPTSASSTQATSNDCAAFARFERRLTSALPDPSDGISPDVGHALAVAAAAIEVDLRAAGTNRAILELRTVAGYLVRAGTAIERDDLMAARAALTLADDGFRAAEAYRDALCR